MVNSPNNITLKCFTGMYHSQLYSSPSTHSSSCNSRTRMEKLPSLSFWALFSILALSVPPLSLPPMVIRAQANQHDVLALMTIQKQPIEQISIFLLLYVQNSDQDSSPG